MSKSGAPTKYDPKYCDELIEYFSVKPYEIKSRQVLTKSGDVATIEEPCANDTPSFAGFCILIGVHGDTLRNWSSKHKEFKHAYLLAKEYQKNFLIVNGNKSLVAPSFAMFTMKNVCGWRDKHPEENDNMNINISLAEKMAKARARVNMKKTK